MSIPHSSLQKIPLSYASCSIGCSPNDILPRRLQAIAEAGFSAIELSFPDILDYGAHISGNPIAPDNYPAIIPVAEQIRKLCEENGLKIMMLQPFSNFEGWVKGSVDREEAYARATGWMEIMNVVGTDLLQVGATDTPEPLIKKERNVIISDLQALSDILAKRNYRLAYENWCWSTHAPGWKEVWEIVKAVDRPNCGLCLDTFQTAGNEWGDPTTESGLIESVSRSELQKRFEASMDELARSIPSDKIYLLQISDAYKVSPPLEDKTIGGLRARGRWSHDYRPMPYDGGYLPIEDVAKAVLKTGFRGWFSMEIFDSGPQGTGKKYEMGSFAAKAMDSMQKFLKNCATD
ncbi:Xylose isomerase-like, TIM barrel domain [Penicillium camemberti]|uniref:Xylose isomerase-like, TIM barrel domain n=1 Tax=Penicillium camemberti (strain FM 013) TaxID=1429867 RepID=A0A0G4PA48_PENC3|nr:Xylose isomerase-like, TIM barrel domain [Penicillium camemberti]